MKYFAASIMFVAITANAQSLNNDNAVTTTGEAQASNSGVDNGVYSNSKSNTYVFPAPIMPGMTSGTKCSNHGSQSFAIGWNFFSFSAPSHQVDYSCQVLEDIKMLTVACQFRSAALVQSTYLKKQYNIDVKVDDTVVNVPMDKCFGKETIKEVIKEVPVEKIVTVEKIVEVQRKVDTFNLDTRMVFEFNKDTLTKDAGAYITSQLSKYDPKTSTVLVVRGHADNVGSDAYNQKLSESRANTVAQYMRTLGFTVEQNVVSGAGESSPITSNNTVEGRAMNRRVEIQIIR